MSRFETWVSPARLRLERLINSGMAAIIHKPFTRETLIPPSCVRWRRLYEEALRFGHNPHRQCQKNNP